MSGGRGRQHTTRLRATEPSYVSVILFLYLFMFLDISIAGKASFLVSNENTRQVQIAHFPTPTLTA